MDARKAKEQAGRYALCLRLPSGHLIPIGPSFAPTWEGLLQVVSARDSSCQAMSHRTLAVGCCHRRQRAWRQPRFNPLSAEAGPRFGGEPETVPGKEEGSDAAASG